MTNGSWKKTAVGLGLDSVYIYRSEDPVKLRSSLPLKSVTDLEIIHEEEGMPHPYGVRAIYGAGDLEKVSALHEWLRICVALVVVLLQMFVLRELRRELRLCFRCKLRC